MLHCVYFDGSSYFVDSEDFICDEDTKVVFKSKDFNAACDYADKQNEECYS